MNIRHSAMAYSVANLALGCGGLFIVCYLLFFKFLPLIDNDALKSKIALLFLILTVMSVLFAASMLAIYVALALSIGFADSVSGTYSSAIICKGKRNTRNAQIRKVIFLNDNFSIDGRNIVFFISGINPMVCMQSDFHARRD